MARRGVRRSKTVESVRIWHGRGPRPGPPQKLSLKRRFAPGRSGRSLLIASLLGVFPGNTGHAISGARSQAGPPVAVPVAVFGNDSRKPLPPRLDALADKIGLVADPDTGTLCSAWCAGEATIVTSAHCVLRPQGEPGPPLRNLLFRTARSTAGAPAPVAGATRGAEEANVTAGTALLSLTPPIAATSDWAIVRLDRPACKSGGLGLAPRTARELEQLSRQHRLYHVAFHRDYGDWQLAIDDTCRVAASFPEAGPGKIAEDFSATEHLVLHTCDTGGASSGSPLLVDGVGGPEVVAINAGTYVHSTVELADGEVVHRSNAANVANTAVGAGAFAEKLALFERSHLVATRAGITALQDLLHREGLFSGERDGHFGPDTSRAIEAFELAAGLPISGLASTALLARLEHRARGRETPIARRDEHGIETGSVRAKAVTGSETPR